MSVSRQIAALLLLPNAWVFGGIRPSFNLNDSAWNATEILVLAPTNDPGTFGVIETIKGKPLPGAAIRLLGLTPARGVSERLSELSEDFSDPFAGFKAFGDPPLIGKNDRLLVFLRHDGALPEYNPRPDLPADTKGWQPADTFGDLRTSTIWIQGGHTYGFAQTINPGPTHLIQLSRTEGELRAEINAVLQQRDAMDRAMATFDPISRSQQLGALVRSPNIVERLSALGKLGREERAGAEVLFDLLSDESLVGLHPLIITAMAGTGYGGAHFASLLKEETIYWLSACTTLKPEWWNDGSHYDEIQRPRNHYGRALYLLTAIRLSGSADLMPAVKGFAAVWAHALRSAQRNRTTRYRTNSTNC